MTNTPHLTTPAAYHRKNNGCTSWVFFLVLLNIFFVEKHQQRQSINVSYEIRGITTQKKHDGGISGAIFAGFCLVAVAIIVSLGGPWPLWLLLFILGILIAL